MKIKTQKLVFICLFSLISFALFAQTEGDERTGQAGASELLINPWAQSSGMAGANTASVRGLESAFLNVAGLTGIEGTELIFSHASWFADISINAFGFGQKIGDTGAMSVSIMSLDFGEIERTTYQNPDGGIGTFSPQFMNIALSYAKKFTYNMSAGLTVKMISESAAELSANGVALDAGVHYETGRRGEAKFGITLKNIGPRMEFNGDGDDVTVNGLNGYDMTMEIRSASFELPSLLNIGGSYDFYLLNDEFRITCSETFVSNSFSKDQFLTGLEVSWKEMVTLRGGYGYESGILDDFDEGRTTSFKGLSAGFSVELPLSDETNFGLDYSYRPADPLQSVHTFGARIVL
ncbi:MAG: PorV/PorQ family protein [Flavobacteriales bacterium TMED191]|nr:MAG: PorV/PorQ family protein [Flavobacteriales bacterium TMED191]|tara:strand:- start:1439 stop:2488 length:1050 start_codon:yes stop_codon:yes gene_type:complete